MTDLEDECPVQYLVVLVGQSPVAQVAVTQDLTDGLVRPARGGPHVTVPRLAAPDGPHLYTDTAERTTCWQIEMAWEMLASCTFPNYKLIFSYEYILTLLVTKKGKHMIVLGKERIHKELHRNVSVCILLANIYSGGPTLINDYQHNYIQYYYSYQVIECRFPYLS